jgi:hypothetical protein
VHSHILRLLLLLLTPLWLSLGVDALGLRVSLPAPLADWMGKDKTPDPTLLPPPGWRESTYLTANPDVAAAVRDGLLPSGYDHYVRFGRAEGRAGTPNSPAPPPASTATVAAAPPATPEPVFPGLAPASRQKPAAPEPEPAIPTPIASDPPPAAAPAPTASPALLAQDIPPEPTAEEPPPEPATTPSSPGLSHGSSASPSPGPSPGPSLVDTAASTSPAASPDTLQAAPQAAPRTIPVIAAPVTAPIPAQKPRPPTAPVDTAARVAPATAPLLLSRIRTAQNGTTARIVLDLDGPPRFNAPVHKADRLEVELPGTLWRGAPAGRLQPLPMTYRIESTGDTSSRLIIGGPDPLEVKAIFTLPPDKDRGHRLVIDVAVSAVTARGGGDFPTRKRG